MESPMSPNSTPLMPIRQHSSPRRNMSTSPLVHIRSKRKRASEDVDMEVQASDTQQQISGKRSRTLPIGRPMPLSRLLDGLDKADLQSLLIKLCDSHPGLANEVVKCAPKSTVEQALAVLTRLEQKIKDAFPFGGDPKGDYAYDRVLPAIQELLHALMDYVPHFLPPNEEYAIDTLSFVDGATGIISRLPEWNEENHGFLKREAYEEIAGAWILGFREASKKGAGIGAAPFLHKLRHWNEVSKGALESAFQIAVESLSWLDVGARANTPDPRMFMRVHPLQGLFSQ